MRTVHLASSGRDEIPNTLLASSQTQSSEGPFAGTALLGETVRDRRLIGFRCAIRASLARARASCAFTVPWGNTQNKRSLLRRQTVDITQLKGSTQFW